jgi:hypothetical protein
MSSPIENYSSNNLHTYYNFRKFSNAESASSKQAFEIKPELAIVLKPMNLI